MKKPVFVGSAVALITPFNEGGVDTKKLKALIDFHLAHKTDAILVAATTGEAATMPDEEHLATIRTVVEYVNGRVPVIAGTGSNDTAHGIKLAKEATAIGADALLTVTPYYNKTSQEGIYRHFKATAEATHLPIIVYNGPSRTNLNIAPATYKRLSEIENIIGVKECNMNQVPETVSLCGDDLILYSGEDGLVVPLLSMGGKGVISVAAHVVPETMHDMVMAFLNGETAVFQAHPQETGGALLSLYYRKNGGYLFAQYFDYVKTMQGTTYPVVKLTPEQSETLKKFRD